ncbi:uncharacterized protein PG998_013430 [Apiospora kogelbergensis]|uniref:uncharacterized protein n=1 Tax=Apiospora kogelbergensis TaxID=1337665 RepID=UPI00312CF424
MTSEALDVRLDIFGQQPRHNRLYTPICFGFPCDEDLDEESVTTFLRDGLRRLALAFPWIAAQVVRDEAGVFRIRRCDGASAFLQLMVKDLRQDLPAAIAKHLSLGGGGIRASLLDETILAPCGTFCHPTTPTNATGGSGKPPAAAVFILQANLVPGGLLLVANGLHSCMDMAGQAHMMRLLAKACRGEPFSAEELATGNMSRRDILQPLLGLSDEELLRKPADGIVPVRKRGETKDDRSNTSAAAAVGASVHLHGEQQPPHPPPAQPRWSTFVFPGPSLQALKATASATLPSPTDEEGQTPSFISTDDALTALLWRSITRSRLPRLSSSSTTQMTRTVDARGHVPGLPRAYPGDAAFKVSSTSDAASLVAKPLDAVAAELRARLRPDEVRDGIRAHVAKLTSNDIVVDGDGGAGGEAGVGVASSICIRPRA